MWLQMQIYLDMAKDVDKINMCLYAYKYFRNMI